MEMDEGTKAHLVTVRRPSVVHQAVNPSECILGSLDEYFPVALLGHICWVELHAVWHRFDRTSAPIFIDVGYNYFCSLLCELPCNSCSVARSTSCMQQSASLLFFTRHVGRSYL